MQQAAGIPGAEMASPIARPDQHDAVRKNRMRIGDVMSREVITARSDEAVCFTARKMSEHGVSCVVVVDDGRIVGILTEKDLLKGLAAHEADFHRVKVAQQMSSPVEVAAPDLSILAAGRLMEAKGIRRMPIVQDGQLVGIVTQTDITRGLISSNPLRYVSDIMGTNVPTIDAEATVHETARMMAGCGASCIIAVHRQEVAGIVTEKDLLKRVVALRTDPTRALVADIMSFPVVAVPPTYSILSASTKMETMRLHRLVVMEGKEVRGIVTQTDIMRAIRTASEAIESYRTSLTGRMRELMQSTIQDMEKVRRFLDTIQDPPDHSRVPPETATPPPR